MERGLEIENVDPLDSRIARLPAGAGRRPREWGSPVRLALGLAAMPRQVLVILPVGIALGPHGLGILSASVLTSLDPAISVALAALGVFVGVDLAARGRRDALPLAAAGLEVALSIAAVSGGLLLFQLQLPTLPSAGMPMLFVVVLAICAAASSTAPRQASKVRPSVTIDIGDLDDVVPIVLGMLTLAFVRQGSLTGMLSLAAEAIAVAAAIAIAGWLLVSQTASESEQRVFSIGSLLLLAGAAAHLSLSALFVGLVAGTLWGSTGSLAAERIASDVRYLQHPLIVLLLVVAGARIDLTAATAAIALVYLVSRLVGKLVGGWLAGQLVMSRGPRDLGLSLIPPGIVGIAFSLNVLQARGEADAAAATWVTIVVAGSIGSELISLLAPARHDSE